MHIFLIQNIRIIMPAYLLQVEELQISIEDEQRSIADELRAATEETKLALEEGSGGASDAMAVDWSR